MIELQRWVQPPTVAPDPAPATIPEPDSAPPSTVATPPEFATEQTAAERTDPGASSETWNADASTVAETAPIQPLRSRILQQIERTAAQEIAQRPGDDGSELQGRATPRLPSSRGWLSGYVGAVAPQVDSWQEPDGRQRAQVTLADGTIICMERRAPTIEEMMQPWKSTIVTMSRLCGRARPAPVDYSDPRVRPPPRVAGGG